MQISYLSANHVMLYILTSVWVLHIPNASRNMLFNIFHAKKLIKKEIKHKFEYRFQQENGFYKFAPKCWSKMYNTTVILFISRYLSHVLCILTSFRVLLQVCISTGFRVPH